MSGLFRRSARELTPQQWLDRRRPTLSPGRELRVPEAPDEVYGRFLEHINTFAGPDLRAAASRDPSLIHSIAEMSAYTYNRERESIIGFEPEAGAITRPVGGNPTSVAVPGRVVTRMGYQGPNTGIVHTHPIVDPNYRFNAALSPADLHVMAEGARPSTLNAGTGEMYAFSMTQNGEISSVGIGRLTAQGWAGLRTLERFGPDPIVNASYEAAARSYVDDIYDSYMRFLTENPPERVLGITEADADLLNNAGPFLPNLAALRALENMGHLTLYEGWSPTEAALLARVPEVVQRAVERAEEVISNSRSPISNWITFATIGLSAAALGSSLYGIEGAEAAPLRPPRNTRVHNRIARMIVNRSRDEALPPRPREFNRPDIGVFTREYDLVADGDLRFTLHAEEGDVENIPGMVTYNWDWDRSQLDQANDAALEQFMPPPSSDPVAGRMRRSGVEAFARIANAVMADINNYEVHTIRFQPAGGEDGDLFSLYQAILYHFQTEGNAGRWRLGWDDDHAEFTLLSVDSPFFIDPGDGFRDITVPALVAMLGVGGAAAVLGIPTQEAAEAAPLERIGNRVRAAMPGVDWARTVEFEERRYDMPGMTAVRRAVVPLGDTDRSIDIRAQEGEPGEVDWEWEWAGGAEHEFSTARVSRAETFAAFAYVTRLAVHDLEANGRNTLRVVGIEGGHNRLQEALMQRVELPEGYRAGVYDEGGELVYAIFNDQSPLASAPDVREIEPAGGGLPEGAVNVVTGALGGSALLLSDPHLIAAAAADDEFEREITDDGLLLSEPEAAATPVETPAPPPPEPEQAFPYTPSFVDRQLPYYDDGEMEELPGFWTQALIALRQTEYTMASNAERRVWAHSIDVMNDRIYEATGQRLDNPMVTRISLPNMYGMMPGNSETERLTLSLDLLNPVELSDLISNTNPAVWMGLADADAARQAEWEAVQAYIEQVMEIAAEHPELGLGEEFDERAFTRPGRQRAMDAEQRFMDMARLESFSRGEQFSRFGATLIGSMSAAAFDPVQVGSLALPSVGSGNLAMRVAASAGYNAAASAGVELVIHPYYSQFRDDLGLMHIGLGEAVTTAAAGGAVFGGFFGALPQGRRQTRVPQEAQQAYNDLMNEVAAANEADDIAGALQAYRAAHDIAEQHGFATPDTRRALDELVQVAAEEGAIDSAGVPREVAEAAVDRATAVYESGAVREPPPMEPRREIGDPSGPDAVAHINELRAERGLPPIDAAEPSPAARAEPSPDAAPSRAPLTLREQIRDALDTNQITSNVAAAADDDVARAAMRSFADDADRVIGLLHEAAYTGRAVDDAFTALDELLSANGLEIRAKGNRNLWASSDPMERSQALTGAIADIETVLRDAGEDAMPARPSDASLRANYDDEVTVSQPRNIDDPSPTPPREPGSAVSFASKAEARDAYTELFGAAPKSRMTKAAITRKINDEIAAGVPERPSPRDLEESAAAHSGDRATIDPNILTRVEREAEHARSVKEALEACLTGRA